MVDYRPVIERAAAKADGFEWNPFSQRQIDRTAGRLFKKGVLIVKYKTKPSRVFLKMSVIATPVEKGSNDD